jgi:hypothetical protein
MRHQIISVTRIILLKVHNNLWSVKLLKTGKNSILQYWVSVANIMCLPSMTISSNDSRWTISRLAINIHSSTCTSISETVSTINF